MKKEEAISVLEQAELKVGIKWRNGRPEVYISPYLQEVIDFALTKLRPISREQVENAWRGEWIGMTDDDGCTWFECSRCEYDLDSLGEPGHFCSNCGAAMTDEAVQIVMERLEKLYDTDN